MARLSFVQARCPRCVLVCAFLFRLKIVRAFYLLCPGRSECATLMGSGAVLPSKKLVKRNPQFEHTQKIHLFHGFRPDRWQYIFDCLFACSERREPGINIYLRLRTGEQRKIAFGTQTTNPGSSDDFMFYLRFAFRPRLVQ